MTKFFLTDSPLISLERQMQQPPGYRPRRQGIHLISAFAQEDYKEILDIVISQIQYKQLKERIETIFSGREEMIFLDKKHRSNYHVLRNEKLRSGMSLSAGYAATVFLLSADECLWDKIKNSVKDDRIYFNRMKIGRVTLEQYILFHAAKDIYHGTKHISLSELADRELIPDQILKVIVNAFVIKKCGLQNDWMEAGK